MSSRCGDIEPPIEGLFSQMRQTTKNVISLFPYLASCKSHANERLCTSTSTERLFSIPLKLYTSNEIVLTQTPSTGSFTGKQPCVHLSDTKIAWFILHAIRNRRQPSKVFRTFIYFFQFLLTFLLLICSKHNSSIIDSCCTMRQTCHF